MRGDDVDAPPVDLASGVPTWLNTTQLPTGVLQPTNGIDEIEEAVALELTTKVPTPPNIEGEHEIFEDELEDLEEEPEAHSQLRVSPRKSCVSDRVSAGAPAKAHASSQGV